MHLTLVRHGEAGSSFTALGDEGRCLTLRGRHQALATGQALASRGVELSHAWSSPLVRAVQTAELIVAGLTFGGPIEARDHLYPDSRARELIAGLSELDASASVLVVGHMPYMAGSASELLGISVGGLSTAEAFHIELDASGGPLRAELKWRWMGRFID